MSYRAGDVTVRNLECFNSIFTDELFANDILANLKFSLPKLTTTDKLALTAPNGTIVYDTDLDEIQGYSNGSWSVLGSDCIISGGDANFSSTTASTSCADGALVVAGGVGIGKNMNICGELTAHDKLTILGTDASIDSATGALVVTGGVGVGESLFVSDDMGVGNNLDVIGNLTTASITTGGLMASNPVCITDDTNSIDAGDGALVVAGGVGIGEDLNVGQSMSLVGALEINGLDGISVIGTSLDITAGDVMVASGNIDVTAGNVSIGGNVTFGGKLGGNVQVVTAPTTLGNHYMVLVDAEITVTLPNLVNVENRGVIYHIIKRVAGVVVVERSGGNEIVDAGGLVTSIDMDGLIYDRISLIGDDDKWYTV